MLPTHCVLQLRVTLALIVCCLVAVSGCGSKAKPQMPVRVTFRQAALGQDYVARFHNDSQRALALHVILENEAYRQKLETPLQIAPGGQAEIGWLEGWRFLSGETIKISHEDYQDLLVRVP